jgi:hypothetical protein
MKLCMDCKHGYAIGGFWSPISAQCRHPDAIPVKEIDLVAGQDGPLQHRLCADMRAGSCLCGVEGKLWERRDGQ